MLLIIKHNSYFKNQYPKLCLGFANNLSPCNLLKIAEIFKLKSPQLRQNWLSKNDLINLLKLCDYELIKHYNKIVLPIKIPYSLTMPL